MVSLILVRHGIAIDGYGGAIRSDRERPLTAEGMEETHQVARGLKKAGVKIEQLVSSPLVRAKQTADIFAEVFKLEEAMICNDLAPGVNHSRVFDFLRPIQKDSIALFGHEPDMGELAQTLLGAEFELPFKKAGACRIDLFGMPPSSPGILKWFMPPKISKMLSK